EASLTDVAPKLGVAGPFVRKDDTTLTATVGDPAVFREASGLGPSNPIEALTEGEEVTIEFKPQEQLVLISMPRTSKQRSLPISPASAAPEALPDLSLAAYPSLDQTLAAEGVGIRMPAESPPKLEAFIANAETAVSRGFGLFRPMEMRRVVS